MYNENPHLAALEAGDDYVGLGFWSALIPIGVSVIGGAFGDGNAIDKRQYYNGSKTMIWCPERSPAGAVPAFVAQGFEELPLGSDLRNRINTRLAGDRTWDELRIARPTTASQKMHVLINGGNGWRYCPEGETIGGSDLIKRGLVQEVVAAETERRRTLTARAEAVALAAATQAREAVSGVAAAEIIPGISTPLLALGAAGLAAAFFLRR